MSWRAPPSRPAPPVTSESTHSLDQLFVGPSSSSLATNGSSSYSTTTSRSRNPSSTSSSNLGGPHANRSAHALLRRTMQEIGAGEVGENGRESAVAKSNGKVSRNNLLGLNGNGTGNARSRAGSATSSTATTRGNQVNLDGSEISLRAFDGQAVHELMSNNMEDEGRIGSTSTPSRTLDKGKGKAQEPTSSTKRVRLDRTSTRSRKNSCHLSTTPTTSTSLSSLSCAGPSSASSSSCSSLSPTRSSSSHIAPLQPSRPVASTSTSSVLSVPPSQGFLNPKRWIGRTGTVSSATTAASILDVPSEPSSGPRVLIVDAQTSTAPVGEPSAESPRADTLNSTACTQTEASAAEEDGPSTPKAEIPVKDLPETAQQASPEPQNVSATATGGSWLNMITRSVYGNPPVDVARAVEDSKAAEGGDDVRMEVDAVTREQAQLEGKESGQDIQALTAEFRDDTVPQAPAGESYDSDTLTPRTVRPSRSSWWLWGAAAEPDITAARSTEGSAPVAATAPIGSIPLPSPEQTGIPQSNEPPDERLEDEEMSTSSSSRKNATRSWMQTIWGESPEELAERRKREAKAFRMVVDRSNLRIEGAPGKKLIEEGPALQDSHPSTSVNSTSSYLDSSSSSISDLPKQLKTKTSSWAIFSRVNGVASSAASTRSRASSQQAEVNSLPPSPNLRPQPDGPVKPLTGSIRSTTPRRRERTDTPLGPDPPIENLVLPTFNDTFLRTPRSFPPKKSNLNRAVSLVSAYLFSHPPTASPPQTSTALPGALTDMRDDPAEKLPKALEIMGEPSRLSSVKRVVCVGVHGWFPNARLKSVLGEPTGTSVKFATMMHDAIQAYLESSGVSSFNIQAIALEGQGQVEDRVNKLYTQLSERDEWVQALRKADVVFLATHSQGTVVSTQLLARMLDQKLIVGTQTHLLAMCGISQGPFVYLYQSVALAPYFNYLESAAARELFDFQDAESVVSIKFLESLRVILNAGIKVTVVGSINDQVVPLYSALFSGVSHPAIVRAVYIDSDAFQTSDFLANLVVFSARLRNAGLSDHDLVYHLSEALSGALTGVGHSKIYEEEEVFNLAVRHQFETTSLVEAPTYLDIHAQAPPLSMSFQPRDRRNPYLLTWALRGIIEDPHVRHLFGNELKALGEAFETWKPQTKVLKDCKLKLEGIRMMTRNTAGKL